jgi:protein-S-isoprenylcysteine O-methyltransferase Ste14
LPTIGQAALAAFSTIVFGAFVWAVRGHFRSAVTPFGMKLVSIVSLAAFVVFLWQILNATEPLPASATAVAVLLQGAALALFVTAVGASRDTRLTLAFDTDLPTALIRRGPYRLIRHPFYASYILFWVGCAIGVRTLSTSAFALALAGIYLAAAILEERKFDSSALAASYSTYSNEAGLFWPRIRTGRR